MYDKNEVSGSKNEEKTFVDCPPLKVSHVDFNYDFHP